MGIGCKYIIVMSYQSITVHSKMLTMSAEGVLKLMGWADMRSVTRQALVAYMVHCHKVSNYTVQICAGHIVHTKKVTMPVKEELTLMG